jgi:hypothetical protein
VRRCSPKTTEKTYFSDIALKEIVEDVEGLPVEL